MDNPWRRLFTAALALLAAAAVYAEDKTNDTLNPGLFGKDKN